MGRYHAPSDLDSSLSANNSSTSRLAARTTPSNPTVRFEMPFAIWCHTCPRHSTSALIGQGVRFNAHKRKIGNYFSSPIWSFRIKHTACGGAIEIRTDPANSDFVVTEGAKRRDYGEDSVVAARSDALLLEDARAGGQQQEGKVGDAFAALEGKTADKVQKKTEAARVEELKSLKDRDWRDPDAAGRRVRDAFRSGRRKRQADGKTKERLQEAMGLGIELLDETEEDVRRAGLVEFGENRTADDPASAQLKATAKPLFTNATPRTTKAERASQVRNGKVGPRNLQEELTGNTRAAIDPFTASGGDENVANALPRKIAGLKRKRILYADESQSREDAARPSLEQSPVKSHLYRTVDFASDDSTMQNTDANCRYQPNLMNEQDEAGLQNMTETKAPGRLVNYDSD